MFKNIIQDSLSSSTYNKKFQLKIICKRFKLEFWQN